MSNQNGNFTVPLDSQGIFMQDPQTGMVLDTTNGMTFMDINEAAHYDSASFDPERGNAMQEVAQMAMPAAVAGSMLPWEGMLGGASAATAAAPAAASTVAAPVAGSTALMPGGSSFATSLAPVGTHASGGTMLANGTVAPAAQGGMLAAGSPLLMVAGLAAGAATGYQQATGAMDIARGRRTNPLQEAALALPTFGLSFLNNPARKLFGSKKHGDQKIRDDVRSDLRSRGFFNEGGSGYDVTMGDFTMNWGKDGGARLQNQGVNIDGRMDRRAHDVDWSRADSGAMVGALNPLGYLMGGGSNRSGDFTGYAVNTMQGAGQNDPRAMYQRAGYDYGSARHGIQELFNQGRIDEGKRDAFFNGLDSVFAQGAYKR